MPTNPQETVNRFLDMPWKDNEASAREKREIWRPTLCVEVSTGQAKGGDCRPATEQDRLVYGAQYHEYLDRKAAKRGVDRDRQNRKEPKVTGFKGLLPPEGDDNAPPDLPERNLGMAREPLTEYSDITHPEYPAVNAPPPEAPKGGEKKDGEEWPAGMSSEEWERTKAQRAEQKKADEKALNDSKKEPVSQPPPRPSNLEGGA